MIDMNEKIMAAIAAHAAAEYPRECCGLVIQIGRKLEYVPCKNHAQEPTEHYVMSDEDWADAEDRGEVIRTIHSHPGDGCRPIQSAIDRDACNASGVVMGIIAWPSGEYAEFQPVEEPLIGRKFSLGGNDCYGIVLAFHKAHGIDLIDCRVPYAWWERGENLIMDNYERAGFVRKDNLQPGDTLIMQIGAGMPNHWAVYLGDNVILHHMYNGLSHKCTYNEYLRGCTRLVVRHKDMPMEIIKC